MHLHHYQIVTNIFVILFYYSPAVDPILSIVLNDITTQQTHDTMETAKAITKLLKLCDPYPNASII